MDALLTTTEAATAARVSKQLFNYWRSRDYIKPADHDERGKPLYRHGDVLQVERAMRRSPRSQRALQAA